MRFKMVWAAAAMAAAAACSDGELAATPCVVDADCDGCAECVDGACSAGCPGGYLCLSDACAKVCQSKSHCPEELACVDEVCGACTADSDCNDNNDCSIDSCDAGTCRYDVSARVGKECSTTAGTDGLCEAAASSIACVPRAVCGNGTREDGETCDDGTANSDTEPDACRTNCEPAGCGDGVEDSDEGCDLGTGNSDTAVDGCRTDCQPAWCGDGVQDSDEGCDLGAGNSDTAVNGCRTDCQPAWCGDGVQDSDEGCDLGAGNSDTAVDGCRTDCRPAWCGDGVQDSDEGCDLGAGNSDTAVDGCRTDCQPARCGDGVIDTSELCDDADDDPSDGCDSCSVATQQLNETDVVEIAAAINPDSDHATVIYVYSDANGDHLVSRSVGAPGGGASEAAALSVINTLSPPGSIRGLRVARRGDEIAVAYTHAYEAGNVAGIPWNAARSYVATSADAGASWRRDLRMDTHNTPPDTLPTNANCPPSAFQSLNDGAVSNVGFVGDNLAVITQMTRRYGVDGETCTTAPLSSASTTSSLSGDLGASFDPFRRFVASSAAGNAAVWAPADSSTALVALYPSISSHPVYTSSDGGVVWNLAADNELPFTGLVFDSSHRYVIPQPGSLVFFNRQGSLYRHYNYSSSAPSWTADQVLQSSDARLVYKRVAISDQASRLLVLWNEAGVTTGGDPVDETILYAARSTDRGRSFDVVGEQLLSTTGNDELGLVDAHMSPADEVTAMVCLGAGMKTVRRQIVIIKFEYPGQNVPCLPPQRLGLIRWLDGETPSLSSLEPLIAGQAAVLAGQLLVDAAGALTAVWADNSSGTTQIYIRRIR